MMFLLHADSRSPTSPPPPFFDRLVLVLIHYVHFTQAHSTSWLALPNSFRYRSREQKNEELASTFNTIASIYGDEAALKMVKIQPSVLAFEKSNFQPSLDAFGETFGYEESKEMVIRNPGLLGSSPASAAGADDLTMQLSYVVAFTRPIGALGPATIIGLLCVPALESALGVGKGELFSALFG
ncbi:hypothetical protein ACHAWC_009130 [Mediolabrus comicus]